MNRQFLTIYSNNGYNYLSLNEIMNLDITNDYYKCSITGVNTIYDLSSIAKSIEEDKYIYKSIKLPSLMEYQSNDHVLYELYNDTYVLSTALIDGFELMEGLDTAMNINNRSNIRKDIIYDIFQLSMMEPDDLRSMIQDELVMITNGFNLYIKPLTHDLNNISETIRKLKSDNKILISKTDSLITIDTIKTKRIMDLEQRVLRLERLLLSTTDNSSN